MFRVVQALESAQKEAADKHNIRQLSVTTGLLHFCWFVTPAHISYPDQVTQISFILSLNIDYFT